MSRRLQLQFADARTFDEEFHKNISKGGAFVASTSEPEVRSVVEVELDLSFCGEQRVLEAEVVHVVPGTGVAVQFLRHAEELRDELDEFLLSAAGTESAGGVGTGAEPMFELDPGFDLSGEDEPDEAALDDLDDAGLGDLLEGSDAGFGGDGLEIGSEDVGSEPGGDRPIETDDLLDATGEVDPLETVDDRRRSQRASVSMPVRLESTNIALEGRTRDLSETGVLVSADGNELPLGKTLQLELQHPDTGERMVIAGTVRRRIEAEGTVAAVGINFEPEPDQEDVLLDLVGQAKRAQAERAASGISGRIEELGMPNLMQMLCASSSYGTLTAQHRGEEGVFAFEDNMIRYVQLGGLRGIKALSRMFRWEEGTFQFHASVEALTDEDEPIPLTNAILEAARQLDEAARPELPSFDPVTRFAVDLDAARGRQLSRIEEAVLELAMPGLSFRRILDVIPETDADVLEAIRSLVSRGVLMPSTDD